MLPKLSEIYWILIVYSVKGYQLSQPYGLKFYQTKNLVL